MYLRSLEKTRKDVSLHDPIGTDKEGNEITLIDILGSEDLAELCFEDWEKGAYEAVSWVL